MPSYEDFKICMEQMRLIALIMYAGVCKRQLIRQACRVMKVLGFACKNSYWIHRSCWHSGKNPADMTSYKGFKFFMCKMIIIACIISVLWKEFISATISNYAALKLYICKMVCWYLGKPFTRQPLRVMPFF